MFQKGDEEYQEDKDSGIESEDDGKITFGINHIIATFFSTLIGAILGFYLANIW